MKSILIAFRNLNRQKKRSFLLGGAIAFGILIITLINGFTGSFVKNVGENFSHLLGAQRGDEPRLDPAGPRRLDRLGGSIEIVRDDNRSQVAIGA